MKIHLYIYGIGINQLGVTEQIESVLLQQVLSARESNLKTKVAAARAKVFHLILMLEMFLHIYNGGSTTTIDDDRVNIKQNCILVWRPPCQ